MMTQGTRNVLAAAKDAGVERFVLMSALGTSEHDEGRSSRTSARSGRWSRTSSRSGLEHTIFRPSFVFGRGGALPTFMKQVRYSPVVTVIGSGKQRIQPIWVDDVARVLRARRRPPARPPTARSRSAARTSSTWDELYLTIAKVLGKRRRARARPARRSRAPARG